MIVLNFNVDGIFVLPWNENVLKLLKVFTTLKVRSYWYKSDSDSASKWFHRKSRSHKSATKIKKNRFLAVQMNLQSTLWCSLSLSKNCVRIKLRFYLMRFRMSAFRFSFCCFTNTNRNQTFHIATSAFRCQPCKFILLTKRTSVKFSCQILGSSLKKESTMLL